jgi:hypothetical protein
LEENNIILKGTSKFKGRKEEIGLFPYFFIPLCYKIVQDRRGIFNLNCGGGERGTYGLMIA